ncbi:MAG: hypothetical protein LUD17_05055 [Bacteroidales bacterium]|nr:hypothetical protein [Bacteroidales bacterium]
MTATTVNPKEILLENIMIAMSGQTFGQILSAKLVGGHGKLLKLIEQGKIEVDKPCASQNGKWRCNAAQVLAHVKNFRK